MSSALAQGKMMASGGGLAELRSRLLFVLLAIVVYRIGSHIPIPGIDPERLQLLFSQNQGGILDLVNMFGGGALERMSIFALGIMPYISSSIITQLLVATTPSLQQLRKEGEAGRKKISQYTRYGTLGLALVQGMAMSSGLVGQGLSYTGSLMFHVVAVTTLVTGAMFIMWLGEQVTEKGIGNGISIIIFTGIVSGFPGAIGQSVEQARQGEIQEIALLAIAALAIAIVAGVVYVERGQRRITINYARRQQGRKMYQAQSSHLPLKVNMAGVIPAIFASSLLLFPASLGQWFGQSPGMEWLQELSLQIAPGQPLNIILFSVGIIFFCFWYTSIMFNPKEVADNLKKSGAFVPGYRPGDQTARYIDSIITRLTLFGSLYMTIVCLLPQFLVIQFNITFQLGGTALLIVVVVVMDFMAQVQTHLMSHQYESLMKKSNLQNFGRR
ncbi:MAG: preprotein translocase subunit SecY [Gammaproteobacteria bacterium]|jgi:preprotein translocase subunit SecY|nr:preprotein translocase subunit SecY [Gammaproteobacteria bacterium]MBT5203067.1 preprotein translocase subunit SecY [Gammaproteobacteria bacterium]MBT5602765.1 preprotein translocase subunit SecY [Gammaproteobacteria bacterium]MBT6247052.1 preprotein translocase subunit SecY [Gammaproteobacteria bacterium]